MSKKRRESRESRKRNAETKRKKTGLYVLLGILILLLIASDFISYLIWRVQSGKPTLPSFSGNGNEKDAVVAKILSGDTVRLDSGKIVRLAGIDAPEPGSAYSTESISFLQFLILNKTVRLESDTQDKDSQGYLLRYVFVDYNGEIFVNAESIRKGYAVPSLAGSTKYINEIEQAREDCLEEKSGICRY